METLAGRIYVEDADAEHFVRAYDEVQNAVLDTDASAGMISGAEEDLR